MLSHTPVGAAYYNRERNRPLKLVVRVDLRNKICSFNLSEEGGKMAAQEKKTKKNRQPEYTSETRRHLKDNGSKREMCVLIVAIC